MWEQKMDVEETPTWSEEPSRFFTRKNFNTFRYYSVSYNLYFSWLLYDVIFTRCEFHLHFSGHFWNGNLKRIEILIIVKWLRALFSFIIRELARIGSSIGYLYIAECLSRNAFLYCRNKLDSSRILCYNACVK